MKFNFSSIEQAPRALPIWQTLITDLGEPHPKRVAKVLGVSLRTVYRYNRTGVAPRSACLALFWLTRWGRSQVYCQAVNDATAAAQLAQALKAENVQLQTRLHELLALGESSAPTSANGGPHALLR